MKKLFYIFSLCLLFSCSAEEIPKEIKAKDFGIQLEVLGIMQDGGLPHAGCQKTCCRDAFDNPDLHQEVVALGLRDFINNQYYLFEATPDLPSQMKKLVSSRGEQNKETPDGIFLSHAHIGHYTGLMYLSLIHI